MPNYCIFFNIYFINHRENFFLNKIYNIKYSQIFYLYKINQFKKALIHYSFQGINDCKLTFYGKNNIEQSFFRKIISITIHKRHLKYFISYVQLNPILKKITIRNHNQLKIPKRSLIKFFEKQIGLPFNYLDIQASINLIYKWYAEHDLKLIDIGYSIQKNLDELNIDILEGQINEIIIIHNTKNKTSHDEDHISALNKKIKQELSLFKDQVLNIQDLELSIHKIKHKYLIDDLRYKLSYNSTALNIVIKYHLKNNNRIIYSNSINYRNFKKNIQKNLHSDYKYQLMYKILYNRLSNFIYTTLFKQLNHIISDAFSIHEVNFFLSISNFTLLDIFYLFNNKLKDEFLSLRILKLHPYLYSMDCNKIKITWSFKYLDRLIINPKIFNQSYYLYNKQFSILSYRYIYFFKNKRYFKVDKSHIKGYQLISKYNYFPVVLNKFIRRISGFNVLLNKIIYSNCSNYTIINRLTNHIYFINIKYYKYYKLPILLHHSQTLTFSLKIPILIGCLKKYFIVLDSFAQSINNVSLQKQINNLCQIEYKLYFFKTHSFYLLVNYMPSLNNLIQANDYLSIIENKKSCNIIFQIGLQFNIPIVYIPNIRLELRVENNVKFLFYFHKHFLSYS